MELCPNCKKKDLFKKILACKFCNKYFCSINCLMEHSSFHSKTTDLNMLMTLKKKQSKNKIDQYSFIIPGVYTENYKYDEKYDISNFTKIYEGFIPIELGRGSFGCVYLVKHKMTDKKYALKVMNKRKILQTYGNCQLIHNEIEIQSKLNHPNIIRLYNMSETEEEINVLLEYAENGNLFSLIQKEKGFSEHKAYKYFIQIVNAVYFLHQNNIIHRDIKPENILIGENNLLKLCDFGWAKELIVNNRSTFCGTVEYMAPEIVGSEKYDCSVDVWSLGILLYELLMGHSPFKSKKEKNIMIKIKLHDLVFDKDKPLSKDCMNLITGLLDANPLNRLKLKDIFNHPFIISNSKLEHTIINSKRRESLDDSNENILKYFNEKNANFTKELKKKFGFDSKLSFRDKLSSKQLLIGQFQSDKNLRTVRKLKKIEKKESQRLEKLIVNMSNELEKGKKKIDDLNFQKSKQFSFEDFRDSKMLYDDKKVNFEEDNKINEQEESNSNIIPEQEDSNIIQEQEYISSEDDNLTNDEDSKNLKETVDTSNYRNHF